jgi:hypothetical protein
MATRHHRDVPASSSIVQRGLGARKALSDEDLAPHRLLVSASQLILLALRAWLAALDDFRNWLIQEAA